MIKYDYSLGWRLLTEDGYLKVREEYFGDTGDYEAYVREKTGLNEILSRVQFLD